MKLSVDTFEINHFNKELLHMLVSSVRKIKLYVNQRYIARVTYISSNRAIIIIININYNTTLFPKNWDTAKHQ